MFHTTPKRLIASLLTALLALSLVMALVWQFGGAFTHNTVHAAQAQALSDVEDNDLPHGSYNNHLIHLHPASQILASTIHFSITGGGLPTGATLTFYSDFQGRCSSNDLDGATVVVTGDGSFPPQPFDATGCPVGNYLIEAIDPLNRVYDAVLTISS